MANLSTQRAPRLSYEATGCNRIESLVHLKHTYGTESLVPFFLKDAHSKLEKMNGLAPRLGRWCCHPPKGGAVGALVCGQVGPRFCGSDGRACGSLYSLAWGVSWRGDSSCPSAEPPVGNTACPAPGHQWATLPVPRPSHQWVTLPVPRRATSGQHCLSYIPHPRRCRRKPAHFLTNLHRFNCCSGCPTICIER